MTLFRDTDAAAEFIATADSRNTSPEVMRAIAFYAYNAAEAVALWNVTSKAWGSGRITKIYHIIRRATDNGRLHGADLHWGDRTLDQIMADEEWAWMPFTIFTGCATNNGYYLALAVAARDEAQAMRAFRPWLKESKQYGGNYVFESGLTARLPDEQGDYLNDAGSGSVDLSRSKALRLLDWPLRPMQIDAGSNAGAWR